MKSFNDKGYGVISGRIQSLSMARNYDLDEQNSTDGANSTLGGVVGYTSPGFGGFDIGLAYNYAGELYDDNNTDLLANDAVDILNEAWGRYRLSKTSFIGGRKINNGDVFRADDIRQKSRSLLAVLVESNDVDKLQLTAGHAFQASDVFQKGDKWEFNNFGDTFGATGDTDGVSWLEANYTGVEKLELALFDALAWDVTNMIGARLKYDISPKTSILSYLRTEFDTGSAPSHKSSTLGLSVVQKVGAVRLEGGYLGVYDDGLKFQQTTTGFNHALGLSLMIYTGQWAGGANSYYIKATTQLETAKTILYLLGNYTDNHLLNSNGYEFDAIVKQPLTENFMITFKGGFGHVEKADGSDKQGTDVRLFLTCNF